jgi:acyl-CoA synthetase (AMP-forming)/AMP-acid ligase II
MAVALAKHPLVDGFDITTVRVLISGAAPLDEALGKAVEAKLNARMIQGYGMTELSPVSHVTPVDRPDLSIGSIGLALPNTEFRLVDPATGADIEANPDGHSAAGELWIRGPQVMRGYLNNESATAETIDAEGWLHTGDIGELAADGTVFIVDRLKELIKYKGYQVPPAELEALLLTHPAIADSAVVAYPDEESGEIPRAFVVVKDGEKLSAEEVVEFVAARVAPYKKVRLVQFTDAIPKSASGKILRKDLRGLPVA